MDLAKCHFQADEKTEHPIPVPTLLPRTSDEVQRVTAIFLKSHAFHILVNAMHVS